MREKDGGIDLEKNGEMTVKEDGSWRNKLTAVTIRSEKFEVGRKTQKDENQYSHLLLFLLLLPLLVIIIFKNLSVQSRTDGGVRLKEAEMLEKYLNFVIKVKKLYIMKVTVLPIIISVFEIDLKYFEKWLEEVEI